MNSVNSNDGLMTGRPGVSPPSRTYLRREAEPVPPRRTRSKPGYWSSSRGASAAVVIVIPLLLIYEAGLTAFGGDLALRTGLDAWIVGAIPTAWRVPDWAGSLTIALGVIAWRIAEPGRFPIRWLVPLVAECLTLGAGLLGLYLGFERLLSNPQIGRLLMDVGGWLERLEPTEAIGLIGAGPFEETVFRLGLLGLLYAVFRLLHVPNVLATALAVSGSALAFSMAHHIGEAPGAFTWPVFVFRWLAGAYFAWVYILRGFGIAVGTHVAYDLLVALYPWPEA